MVSDDPDREAPSRGPPAVDEGTESAGADAGGGSSPADEPEGVRELSGASADEPSTSARTAIPADERRQKGQSPNTVMNALVGAVVTLITTFFLPFSPILGGAVAGYLEGGETNDGLRVGALAGGMALVPLLLIVPLLLFVFLFDPFVGFGIFVIAAFAVVFLTAYTVGLSLLGGVVGVYLRTELSDRERR